MAGLLFWLLFVECLLILSWGLIRRERLLQYPFLAATVFAGWVLPQIAGLLISQALPEGCLEKTLLMAILCLGAAYFGYQLNTKPASLFQWQYRYSRLLKASIMLSLVGAYFFYEMSRLAPEAGAQWTGRITIYLFFSGLLTFGFVIAILLHLKRPTWVTWSIIAFNCSLYLERILIAGRRAAMIEFGMIILLAVWFKWRWVPARWFVVCGLVVGALLVHSMAEYRMSTSQEGIVATDWNKVLSIDYVGNLKRLANEGGQELRNAAYGIEAADRSLSFDYGASIWNSFVLRYVPGQLIGKDIKSSLLLDLGNPALEVFGYTPWFGTTPTGLQTAFLSFWFFGAAIFALIGLIMSRWYKAAMQDNLAAQILTMLLPTHALHAITHHQENFFMPFIQWAVFLLPVLIYARVKQTRHRQTHPAKILPREKERHLSAESTWA